jgi:uncharacterized membrane protein YccC
MPPADAPAPVDRTVRLRLLVSDLLAFDRHRLNWVLAVRTMIGLLVPLSLARLLDVPSLTEVGIAAFLIGIGDCVDDGDGQQLTRLGVGTALGAAAVTTGVLAGASLPSAVLGMLIWGGVTGLLGAYGSAFATMALPIVWAYVELGLPAVDHALGHALMSGGLFAAGGALTAALTFGLRARGSDPSICGKTASCFCAWAGYVSGEGGVGPVSPETRVRAHIAEARRVAAGTALRARETDPTRRRCLALIDIVDRLFSLAAVLRESQRQSPEVFRRAGIAVADALTLGRDEASLRAVASELDVIAERAPTADDRNRADIENRIRAELTRALRLVQDDRDPVEPRRSTPSPVGPSRQHGPAWRAVLHPDSVVGRHALRFAVVCAVAVVIFWVFPSPFAYWIPLTATVVLKPSASSTLARAVQRIAGTIAGVILGMALVALLPSAVLQGALMSAAFFCMMAVLPSNYGLGIFFLSLGLIPLEHVLNPGLPGDIGLLRLGATALGAALALAGGFLLWPTFESRALPARLRTSIASMAAYADLVLAAVDGIPGQQAVMDARSQAGRDLSDLQSAVQQTCLEIRCDPDVVRSGVSASAAQQQIMNTLNALMNATVAREQRPPTLASFRAAFGDAMANLGKGQADSIAAGLRAAIPEPTVDGRCLADRLTRLSGGYETLREAAAHLSGRGLQTCPTEPCQEAARR